ncbi:uncharacterized protein LOC121423922 [Lytechinus variegatus]|uniref:uncharacterized protein LOC121423922 n=1 Tax=Lytechinus variegatus TaxID=7654 RepID=UPI001BB2762E|nr:uncharacterized protein LOC121423922 [Lytechinus variegatus]
MMSGNKERRHHGSGVAKTRADRAPREGDDRTRSRRLADIRRGNKTRHQIELLTNAHGGIKKQSSTPSSWRSESRTLETWSAKEKRERTLPKPPDLETRNSCPALPAISPSLGIHIDSESRQHSPKTGLYGPRALGSNAKTTKQESLNLNLPNDKPRIMRDNSLDLIANVRHPSSKVAAKHKFGNQNSKLSMPLKNDHVKTIQYESKMKRTFSVPDIASSTQPSDLSEVRQIAIKEAEISNSDKDRTESDSTIGTKHRYSVLLKGGTSETKAPYVARIGSETIGQNTSTVSKSDDVRSRFQRTSTDDAATKDGEDHLQKPTTAPRKREGVSSPSRRRGRHLRSHKELFAFQQDLLLPRYRKLAGISGGDAEVPPNDRRSADESQGGGTHTRRSDAREVFEKVRLIIKGPEKVETVTKPTDRKVPQMMPIYLKSGLPCGYVDSSSKCDAWLDSNDFDD